MASTLKITQVRSAIRQTARQKRTLEALGLRRMHQTVVHNDTPQIRGMLDRVSHLVSFEVAAGERKAGKEATTTKKEAVPPEAKTAPSEEKAEKAEQARKATTKKSAAGKSASKKTSARKSATKKSASKKTATKKSAGKSSAKKDSKSGSEE